MTQSSPSIPYPDRTHRSVAEVWNLTDEDIKAERRADEARGEQPKDWRKRA